MFEKLTELKRQSEKLFELWNQNYNEYKEKNDVVMTYYCKGHIDELKFRIEDLNNLINRIEQEISRGVKI